MQTFISNSKLGIRLAMGFGRFIPPGLGYPITRVLADIIARRRNWGMVRAARLNQWVASGQRSSSQELDRAVQEALRFQARSIYDLYRYLAYPEKMDDKIYIPPEMVELIENSRQMIPGQGKILVSGHLSNYDFVLHMIVRHGWKGMVITMAELPGGYQEQLKLRREAGMEIVPASVSSFRLAIERLKAGEMILTGIDRPLANPKHWPRFFGHPAPLPVHHIYMALKANVPIVFLAPHVDSQGVCRLSLSQPIYMTPDPDRNEENTRNAEAVLAVEEHYIRQAPSQWAMYYPVWPELIETVP